VNPDKNYLVVARTDADAEAFIAEHKLLYARNVYDFRTIVQYHGDGVQVVLVGDCQLRRDWKELERVLGIRDLLRTAVKAPL
jgi:hypothetical protein